MILLLIRNVKRAGDLPHLKIKLIEQVKVEKSDKWTEYKIAEHGKAGQSSQLAKRLDNLSSLQSKSDFRLRAEKLQKEK